MFYMALTDPNKWTDKQRKFMAWLALPSYDRQPLAQYALAAELKVHETTLCAWRKLPGFMDEVKSLITASLGDVYHDVMHSFKAEAKKGSYQHQKTYFEMLGVYTPKSEVKGTLEVSGGVTVYMPENGRDNAKDE